MKRPKIRRRVLTALLFVIAAVSSVLALSKDAAALYLPGVQEAGCMYAGQEYSWNACRGGQRCSVNRLGEYYWEDDSSCPQSQGGYPQV